MSRTNRQHLRVPVDYGVALFWEDSSGQVHNAQSRARDASDSGMRVESPVPIEPGTVVCMDVPSYGSAIEAIVRYCVSENRAYRVGVEFAPSRPPSPTIDHEVDYYEVLQLSQKADLETIHRVYRIMAARFHPDNPDSGDRERFLLLSEAYRVLSDPAKRAQYDQLRSCDRPRPLPLFQARAFVDEKQGEVNRRLGVLCLLYAQRRRVPDHPEIALIALEAMMSIPREYLEFTLWYLKQKRFVEMDQGADYCLTAAGVDFVEEHTLAQDILLRLLTSGKLKDAGAPQSTDFASAHVQ